MWKVSLICLIWLATVRLRSHLVTDNTAEVLLLFSVLQKISNLPLAYLSFVLSLLILVSNQFFILLSVVENEEDSDSDTDTEDKGELNLSCAI
jgi:hypothetical protein